MGVFMTLFFRARGKKYFHHLISFCSSFFLIQRDHRSLEQRKKHKTLSSLQRQQIIEKSRKVGTAWEPKKIEQRKLNMCVYL